MTTKKSELAERIDAGPQKTDGLRSMLEHHAKQFGRNLTTPAGDPLIHPEKFVRVALTTIRTTPRLAQATDASLLGALMTCSQLGLEPGGPLGQAYLVPFENRQLNTIEAQLIIGYQGFIDLMYRSDRVASVSAHAVYEADFFQFELGTNAHLVHRPQLDERGELRATYGIAELVTGAKPFEVLSRQAIEKRRSSSRSADSKHSPWNSHFEAMARKSAIRALFKWIPSSILTQAAIVADGATFKEIPRTLDDVDTVIDVYDAEELTDAPEPPADAPNDDETPEEPGDDA